MPSSLNSSFSKVNTQFLKDFTLKYAIPSKYKPTAPEPNQRIVDCPEGYIVVYTKFFEYANLRLPFSFFFLQFLQHYRLNISQLCPQGAMKVIHFEVMCRALGGEPSLPLFERFFRIVRVDCCYYTVQKHRNTSGFISGPYTTLARSRWDDHFFWVSADAIPFKMHWRQPSDHVHPCTQEYDQLLCSKLLLHLHCGPRQFPEHVLILTGLSRSWPYVNAEPIFVHGDQEIDLLKYIEMEHSDEVKLTSRLLSEDEDNILDRTKGICFEGGPSHVPKQPLVDTGGDNLETPPQHTTTEPIVVDLSLSDKSEPIVVDLSSSESDEPRLRVQYRLKTTFQHAKNLKLKKEVKKLKCLNRFFVDEGMHMLAKISIDHAKAVEALKQELEDTHVKCKEQLKQAHEELEQEKKMVEKLKQANEEKMKHAHEELEKEKEMVKKLQQVNEEKIRQVHVELKKEKEMVEKMKQVNEEKIKRDHEELKKEKEMVEKMKQVNEEKIKQVQEERKKEKEMLEKMKQVNEEKLKQICGKVELLSSILGS